MQSISPSNRPLRAAARSSALSRAQVEEIRSLLPPTTAFDVTFVETYGDLDRETSLRTLGRTDFFTREVDQLVLSGECDFGIHSAKDLPEPLTKGLTLFALTRGIDPRDALVLRPGVTLDTLPPGSVIATSSERRIDAVKALRQDFTFIDLRGTIEERLSMLEKGLADGVVIAEAALIRLKLDVNRIYLPGTTVAAQGQLAIVGLTARKQILEKIFSCLDVKKSSTSSI